MKISRCLTPHLFDPLWGKLARTTYKGMRNCASFDYLLIGAAATVEGVRAGLPPETNGVEVVFVAAALAPPPASLAHAFTSSSSHS